METRQLIIKNLLMNYYFGGNFAATAPVVLFLHGWRADSRVWNPITRLFEEQGRYQIYCLDLPGFGNSQAPPSAYSVSDYSETVKEFLKKLNLEKVTIVGHSFGGRVAIKLAVAAPELVAKLVLVNCAGIQIKSWRKKLLFLSAKLFKPFFSLPGLRNLRPKIYRLLEAEDYLATPTLRSTFVRIINEDLTPLLPEIQQKTLLVWGENDQETPLEFAKIMKKNIPDSRLVTFPDAGHFSFIDKTPDFFKILTAFFDDSLGSF